MQRSSAALPTTLFQHHRDHLHESGLTDETISVAGCCSVRDPLQIKKFLRWSTLPNLGDCLVIPNRSADGTLGPGVRLRPDRPRTDTEGKPVKYEQPKDVPVLPYFCPNASLAILEPRRLLGFTEGEKKSLAADQSGLPCIAIPGIWLFAKKRSEEDDRELQESLSVIDFDGRPVWIAFDTDSRRNPQVNHARAELARLLHNRGAEVSLVDLPAGPSGKDGLPGKMGIDDFLVAHGEEVLYDFIYTQVNRKANPRSLDDYRKEMQAQRIASIASEPAVYLDRSSVGAGKSTADINAIQHTASSLTVLPTHKNCQETELAMQRRGVNAVAYPQLTSDTCKRHEEATEVLSFGLSVPAALCHQKCPFANECPYLQGIEAAKKAKHVIATHQRAALTMPSLAEGKSYISIHEDPVALLRPTAEVHRDLDAVRRVAHLASHVMFGRGDMAEYHFFWAMQEAAVFLAEQLLVASTTIQLNMPSAASKPLTCDSNLYQAIQESGLRPSADAIRVCRAIAAGELHELVVRVDRFLSQQGAPNERRSINAVWRSTIPEKSVVWICDATSTRDEIEFLVGRPVKDATPPGELAAQHSVIQVPVDITKGTVPSRVVSRVRAVLAMFSESRRVGIIADRIHLPLFTGTARKHEGLLPAELERIARTCHFRSGRAVARMHGLTSVTC